MSFNTKYPGKHIIVADDPENIVFGTCMLGDTFGEVISASVKRGANEQELEGCGGRLRAIMMNKMNFELTMEVLFTAEKPAPGLAEIITFPVAGVQGRVMAGVEIKWEKDGQRMLSIPAKSFDDFLTNDGAGSAISGDGETTEAIL